MSHESIITYDKNNSTNFMNCSQSTYLVIDIMNQHSFLRNTYRKMSLQTLFVSALNEM